MPRADGQGPLHQIGFAHHTAGMCQQYLKNLVFGGGQLHDNVVLVNPAMAGLDPQITIGPGSIDFGFLIPGNPPQQRLQAGHEFPGITGLGNIVIGTDFKSHDAIRFITPGRQQHNRQVSLCPQLRNTSRPLMSGSMMSRTTISQS